MEDPLILFESLHNSDKQEGPNLHFNLVPLNVNMNIDSMGAYIFLNIYDQLMRTLKSISKPGK